MDVNITRLFPSFLLDDRNGYAMAKAIERMLNILLETIQTGLSCVKNIDSMPEWRLDELAWEQGCLYDYSTRRKNQTSYSYRTFTGKRGDDYLS